MLGAAALIVCSGQFEPLWRAFRQNDTPLRIFAPLPIMGLPN
jgi:hypothetical protein